MKCHDNELIAIDFMNLLLTMIKCLKLWAAGAG